MDTQTEQVEKEFAAFVQEVETRVKRIYGCAGTGRSGKAAVLALALWDVCATTREQRKMRKEVAAGDWNLQGLRVDVTSASKSKKGFEREG